MAPQIVRITPSYTELEVAYTSDRTSAVLRLLDEDGDLVAGSETYIRDRRDEQQHFFGGLQSDTPYTVEITRANAGRDRIADADTRTLAYPELTTAPTIRSWTAREDDAATEASVYLSSQWTGAYARQRDTRRRAVGGAEWTEPAIGTSNVRGDWGASYDVQIRATNPEHQSPWSAPVRVTMPRRYDATLGTPALQGAATADAVQWTWSAIAGAATYQLAWLAPGLDTREDDDLATIVADLTAAAYDLTGLQSGSTYPARVRAETTARRGPWSAWQRVRTLGTSQPQYLVLNSYAGTLEAVWRAPEDGADAYEIRWKDHVATQWPAPTRTTALTYRIPGLRIGQAYDVAVRAVPAQGTASDWTAARGSLAQAAPQIERLDVDRAEYFVRLAAPAAWAPDYYESRILHGNLWGPVRRRGLAWAETGLIGQTAYALQVRARSTLGLMSAWVERTFTTQIGGGLTTDAVLPAPTRAGLHVRLRTAAGAVLGAGPLPVYDVDMRLQVDVPMTWSAAVPLRAADAAWPNQLEFSEPGAGAFLGVGMIDTVRTQIAPAQHRRLLSGLGHLAELGAVDVPADWMGDASYTHATALDRLGARAAGWTFVPASDPAIDTVVWDAKAQTLQEALRGLAAATGTHFIAAGFRIVRFFGSFVASPYVLSLLGEDDPAVLALDAYDAAYEYYGLATRVRATDAQGAGMDGATADIPTPEGYALDEDRRVLINSPLEARLAIQRLRDLRGEGNGANALLEQARAFLRHHARPQTTYQCSLQVRNDRYLPPLVGRRIALRLRDEQGRAYTDSADIHEAQYRISAAERRITLTLTPTGGAVRPRPDQQLADWLGTP